MKVLGLAGLIAATALAGLGLVYKEGVELYAQFKRTPEEQYHYMLVEQHAAPERGLMEKILQHNCRQPYEWTHEGKTLLYSSEQGLVLTVLLLETDGMFTEEYKDRNADGLVDEYTRYQKHRDTYTKEEHCLPQSIPFIAFLSKQETRPDRELIRSRNIQEAFFAHLQEFDDTAQNSSCFNN